MARKSLDALERQIALGEQRKAEKERKVAEVKAAATPQRCSVCAKERKGCKPVGRRLICGPCRYEHATKKEAHETDLHEMKKAFLRHKAVEQFLNALLQRDDEGEGVELATSVLAAAGVGADAVRDWTRGQWKLNDRQVLIIWTVLREMKSMPVSNTELSAWDPKGGLKPLAELLAEEK